MPRKRKPVTELTHKPGPKPKVRGAAIYIPKYLVSVDIKTPTKYNCISHDDDDEDGDEDKRWKWTTVLVCIEDAENDNFAVIEAIKAVTKQFPKSQIQRTRGQNLDDSTQYLFVQ